MAKFVSFLAAYRAKGKLKRERQNTRANIFQAVASETDFLWTGIGLFWNFRAYVLAKFVSFLAAYQAKGKLKYEQQSTLDNIFQAVASQTDFLWTGIGSFWNFRADVFAKFSRFLAAYRAKGQWKYEQ